MKRVLLVEDSRTQARRIAQTLEESGFTVAIRHDGREGLLEVLESPPDLVLSDVLMPEMDGYALCRAIRAEPKIARVPVVLMTSLTDPADVMRALAAGANGYVGKPFEAPVLIQRITRVLESKEQLEVELDGERVPVAASPETILSLLMCALEDSAARIAELAASRARLEHTKAQQDDMMGIVAHELRTPLNVLSLRAGLEMSGGLKVSPAPGRKPPPPFPELVARNVKAMSAIVDDLLDVARIESGAIRVQPKTLDLVSLASDVVSRYSLVSASHPVELVGSGRVIALHDPARVEQMLANLVGNAIKYSPEGGRIVVRVSPANDQVRVEVEDEGMGVPPALTEQLFGRYVRAPGSERVAKGVGLGLYITRRLAELQGGTIGVERREPKGSRFWFTLPAG